MIKTITSSATGGLVHVFKNLPGQPADPEAVCIMTEITAPVELTDLEADELIQAITDVKNS